MTEIFRSPQTSITRIRRRLYGLCFLVALAAVLLIQFMGEHLPVVHVYLPLFVGAMVAVGLAGAEWQVYLQQAAAERQALAAEKDDAVSRQRMFTQLWQMLADSRGLAVLPESVMKEIAGLFTAPVVAVWSADESLGGFGLRGLNPVDEAGVRRLDKIVQASPCFDRLRKTQRALYTTDLARDTSPALAIFCEEKQLPHAVLCPVLVRQEMVGVLALFYPRREPIPHKQIEEMQSAANLLLCAL